MNEFVEQFLLESRELVEQANADLLAVEENPGDAERLDGAFRAFHTLKGSAGIVDFAAMSRAAHAAEDLLAAVRSGKAAISRELVGNCLGCLDLIQQWLDAMQVNGDIPAKADAEADAIVARLGTPSAGSVSDAGNGHARAEKGTLSAEATALLQAQIQLLQEKTSEGLVGRLLSAGRVAVNVLRSSGLVEPIADLEHAAGASAAAEDGVPLAAAIRKLLPAYVPGVPGPEASAGADTAARVLRVDVERIDALVKLTGELIVAKNAVGHAAQLARNNADPQTLAQLLKEQHGLIGRLIEELQRSVLTIRVLPLRHVFNRFPRLVREIAETLGKPARLVTEGDDTEADKVVVEHLFEPLLHIIRNALDHGIETAAERLALGKPPIATINLRAARSGDVVVIEVQDDGRGIDIDKVRALAVKREVAEPGIIAQMSDDEVADLVFAAGFSTAAAITDLSGRGVGMNVVRSNVERLGGTARIVSRPGQGTSVVLRLPFSVMMTRVMTVAAGGQILGLPLDHVVETASIPRDQISAIGKGEAFVLRNRTIPLVNLARTLGQPVGEPPSAEAKIVIVSLDGQLGGLEVERFGDRLDVMLKPMDGILQGMPGVAGTSLLGDGTVLIVLDLQDLLQ
ncbi:MAG TPA: chemotaxis protein CheA [Rhizomicrobium sp.]|jgi:two-component system chemotaxis sensor kinase CheA